MLCLINITIFPLSVDKQAHWLQIMFPAVLNTRSLGTQVASIANKQRACLSKFGKLCSLAFHHSRGHFTYHIFLNVAYLNTLPAGLCIKPLEYILITILKRRTTYVVYVILSRYIVLEIKFTLNTWRGLDIFQ